MTPGEVAVESFYCSVELSGGADVAGGWPVIEDRAHDIASRREPS